MKSFLSVSGALAALSISSCISQPSTTVQVQNDTAFPLEVTVLYDDDQNILEDVLEESGTEVTATLQPGDPLTVTRDCDRLQAVRVSADLQVIGGLGPSKTSRVFRDGDDFGCGSRITLTFTAPDIPTTLDVATTIEN